METNDLVYRKRTSCGARAISALCLFASGIALQAEPLGNVGISVSLSAAEKSNFINAAKSEGGDAFPTIDYVERTEQGTLHLLPRLLMTNGFERDQRSFDYLALLQKGGPIENLGDIGPPRITFMFPSLDVRVVNNSARRLLFSEALVKVASSESDSTPLPFLGASESENPENYFAFFVLNEGWAAMESCSVKFSISASPWKRDPVPQFDRSLGKVARSTRVEIIRELIQAGLSPRWIEGVRADAQPDDALMKPFSGTAYLAGVLSYSWRSASGSVESRSVRFRVNLPLAYGPVGGPSSVSGRYEAMLRAEGREYSLRIPVSHQVDPGTTARFLVRLGVPRTSRHHCNLQLRTTRGETIESAPIVLEALLPPSAAEQLKKDAAPEKRPRP